MKAGSVKRRVVEMERMIAACGGNVVGVLRGNEYPAYGSVWYVYHIKKAI
jgi:hypothetical protein